jgi:putative ABC transport system substrate-binding protein
MPPPWQGRATQPMLSLPGDVRIWGNNGQHLLNLRFSDLADIGLFRNASLSRYDALVGGVANMRRRQFLVVLGATAATSPLTALAQPKAIPMIGFLRSATLDDVPHYVAAFREGLKEAGFVEGENVAIDFRSANNRPDRLRALANELVHRPVAIIVGNNDAALAAKALTTTIPILFAAGSDPIRDGLVTSLNRPGGNVTGATFLAGLLGAKRLELLRQVVPRLAKVGALINPNTPVTEPERVDLKRSAAAIGQELVVVDVRSTQDIETAFATFVQRGANALFVGSGPFLQSNREQIVSLAARHAIPTIYPQREGVDSGGLMSYGNNIREVYRQVGIYAGRILRGERAGDLPVMQASKFELVINLKTAKALGLEFHPQFLAAVDDVVE